MTWDQAGYIRGSDYRTATATALEESKKQPSEIAEETGIAISHVSRALKQLRERDLVQVLNPDAKKGRLYALTDEGRAALENVNTRDDTTDSDTTNDDMMEEDAAESDTRESLSGVFIEIDENNSVVGLQLKVLDESGDKFIAGEIAPEPGRYELRKVSDDA